MARREVVAEVMVRLTAEDFGAFMAVAMPGESRCATFLRCVHESLLPRTCLLRYRKLPLFPYWMRWGPHTPLAAEQRGRQLLAGGFEVEVEMIEPPPPAPLHPDDLLDDDDDDDSEVP